MYMRTCMMFLFEHIFELINIAAFYNQCTTAGCLGALGLARARTSLFHGMISRSLMYW